MNLVEEVRAYAEADFRDVNAAFVERVLELAGAVSRATVLDLGTGPGDIPLRLNQARPGWRILAVDASPAMLMHAHAAARAVRRVQLTLADAKALPFKSRAFDVIISNSILHHITDVAPFWSELARVARPGAWVCLRDLARPDSSAAAWDIVREYSGAESVLLQQEFHRSLLAAYTPDEVRGQLAHASLTTLEVAMVSDRHLDIFGRLRQDTGCSSAGCSSAALGGGMNRPRRAADPHRDNVAPPPSAE
jgi:SAM-dependent methyltransferase